MLFRSDPLDEADDENGLDESELSVLREAGIITSPSSSSAERGRRKSASKHIVFADNEDEGTFLSIYVCTSHSRKTRAIARAFASSSKKPIVNDDVSMDVEEEVEDTWGWKVTREDPSAKRKQKGKAKADNKELAAAAEAERREEALVRFPCFWF